MGIENGNLFFGEDCPRCRSGVESVGNYLPRICRGVEGVVGEVKSVSWGGALTKGELTSVSSSLTKLFFTIKKLAMRTNGIKI